MDPDEERKRKEREKKQKYRETMPDEVKRQNAEKMQKQRAAKRATMTEEDRVIAREKQREKMRKYRSKEGPKQRSREIAAKSRQKNATTPKMAHHGAKPLAPRGVGIPTDAEDLMGNFVFPVHSESDKDEEDFYLPSDEEPDDFFQHHDFGPGPGGAGMVI